MGQDRRIIPTDNSMVATNRNNSLEILNVHLPIERELDLPSIEYPPIPIFPYDIPRQADTIRTMLTLHRQNLSFFDEALLNATFVRRKSDPADHIKCNPIPTT